MIHHLQWATARRRSRQSMEMNYSTKFFEVTPNLSDRCVKQIVSIILNRMIGIFCGSAVLVNHICTKA